MKNNFAIIVPLANESREFFPFVSALKESLNFIKSGVVYFVVDSVSKDSTLQLCTELSAEDKRFITIWAPENKNVVDTYMKGYAEAFKNNHEFIIEMDGGLSHDPRAIPMFLRVLNEGNECAFGSRFIIGGSIYKSSAWRWVLSFGGTVLSNILLGTSFRDMTSGYLGFHRQVVGEFLNYKLKSKAHFYQTELRYLLRKKRFIEVPIHYRAPSPNVSRGAILNSFSVLFYYFFHRILFNSQKI